MNRPANEQAQRKSPYVQRIRAIDTWQPAPRPAWDRCQYFKPEFRAICGTAKHLDTKPYCPDCEKRTRPYGSHTLMGSAGPTPDIRKFKF